MMYSTRWMRLSGWSATTSAVAMLVGAVFPIIATSGLIGKAGTLSTLILALSMLLPAAVLPGLQREHHPGLSAAAALVGVVGMLTAASLQLLLLLGLVQPTGAADILDDLSFNLIGAWLVMNAAAGHRSMPAKMNAVAALAGTGMILVTAGFMISEPPPPWAFAGGVLALMTYPVWAIALSRLLLGSEVDGSRLTGK